MEPCNRSGMTRAFITPLSRSMLLNLTKPSERFYYDLATLLRQIGVLPALGAG